MPSNLCWGDLQYNTPIFSVCMPLGVGSQNPALVAPSDLWLKDWGSGIRASSPQIIEGYLVSCQAKQKKWGLQQVELVKDTRLSSQILGIQVSRKVLPVNVPPADDEVEMEVTHAGDKPSCPKLETVNPHHDKQRQRQRHLDSGPLKTLLVPKVPRGKPVTWRCSYRCALGR